MSIVRIRVLAALYAIVIGLTLVASEPESEENKCTNIRTVVSGQIVCLTPEELRAYEEASKPYHEALNRYKKARQRCENAVGCYPGRDLTQIGG